AFHSYIRDEGDLGKMLLAGYLTKGHVLLEGPPGVAKTSAVKVIGSMLGKKTKRVQFTPDLMPSDIIGYMLPVQKSATDRSVSIQFVEGPIFTDIFIADEINRAPARTQSALLEAMEERSVTVEGKANRLDDRFWVLATQNPREMEGTYPLPEAEIDRFSLVMRVNYQSEIAEAELARKFINKELPIDFSTVPVFLETDKLLKAWDKDYRNLTISEQLIQYAVSIVRKTRSDDLLRYGASPRALFHLINAAAACAVFEGRDFVDFDDIKYIAIPALAHRIKPMDSFGLELESAAEHVSRIIESVPVPR
ncbi:MAG TPA: MoxR family ATPase, partial [Spirochaetota bacterium]|nr:MoxR family ATPase [Spirochaetota bacterium]